MTHGDNSTFLEPLDNTYYLFGEQPVYYVTLKNHGVEAIELLEKLKRDLREGCECILGVRLKLLKELQEKFFRKRWNTGSAPVNLSEFIGKLPSAGFRIIDKVAVFPNFNSARFFLPFEDQMSHRLLFYEILVPRRYSLSIMLRFLLHCYAFLLRVTKNSSFLHQHIYILLEKT
jgi:hypothetical protein